MQFVFNGTLEEFKSTIRTKAQALNKDIVVYHNDPNTLEIGFQRLGHSGGRFFAAKTQRCPNVAQCPERHQHRGRDGQHRLHGGQYTAKSNTGQTAGIGDVKRQYKIKDAGNQGQSGAHTSP